MTDRPTTEVDLFTWMQHLHLVGKAEKDDDGNRVDPRPIKLHSGTRAVAFCIGAHWNREKRMAWPSIETIAFESEVGTATVKRAIKSLEDAGWLIVEHRPKPLPNRYRLASPIAARYDTDGRMDHHDPLNGSPRSIDGITMIHELRSEPRNLTTNFQIRSVGASANRDSSAKKLPTELPADWQPNKFHRSSATSRGLDVDVLAGQFRDQMTGERRTDWGSTFGAFINEYAEYRDEVTFPSFPAVDDDVEFGVSAIDTGPDPTTQAMDWVTPALWMEGINPDTLTADERTTITLAWGDEPAADVARRIRENRDRRYLTVVPNTTVAEVTAQVAAKLGELSEDECDAIDVFVDRHGFGADDLVHYIAAWRRGEPFSLIELEPEEYDPFTGVMNPNPAITDAELRVALDRIKGMLPGGFRGDEMEAARDAICYGDSWSQVAQTLRDGRISA